jgi:phosphoribosylamine--glycine ligase
MKILVIGSGGREHSMVWKIAQSPLVSKIYCAPGNPGIADIAEIIPINSSNNKQLLTFAEDKKIDLTVVGPEDPLVTGIVDMFTERGLKIFGPSKIAAQLEGSKVFAKNLMHKYKLPTATYESFNSVTEAEAYIHNLKDFPVVLKADGLAAGKGVLICNNKDETLDGLTSIMSEKKFGTAGNQMIIEQFLHGEEVSIFALCDGYNYKLLSSAQDHKKVFERDEGKNTGGMGAYAPAPLLNERLLAKIEQEIIKPTIQAMAAENNPYCGMLYFGLIVNEEGPKVLEFNCRFGDPETEVVLPMLESDLVPLLLATTNGSLDQHEIKLKKGYAIDIVLASGGYPDKYEKGKIIKGCENVAEGILLFHAGTTLQEKNLVTNGGRVLNVVALGNNFYQTRDFVYENVEKIIFEDMHYRKDIGYRAVKYLNK